MVADAMRALFLDEYERCRDGLENAVDDKADSCELLWSEKEVQHSDQGDQCAYPHELIHPLSAF
jgi:hypothetical protein